MAIWIIAICAVIWTLRMLLNEALTWVAVRYRYSKPPKWLRVVLGLR